jgi:NAD+ synthase
VHIRANEIAAWLRERVSAARAQGLVVGLSGGVDSAVVAALAEQALPKRVVGVVLPCHSDPGDEAHALLIANRLGIPALRINLEPAYDRLTSDLRNALLELPAGHRPATPTDEREFKARIPMVNITPRLRMTSLYFVANSLNYLVAGSGNRCEVTIGYFTKHGDGGVDLLPIGHLLKSDVRALAQDLGIPDAIIEKPPSAGLWLGQTDESEMGFSYADLERYLTDGPEAVPPALALRIERLVRQTEHKRTLPPIPSSRPEIDLFDG